MFVNTMEKLLMKYTNQEFSGYIFDLDGTLWMSGQLIDGAQEVVNHLRKLGKHVVFLTNNSNGTREMFAQQLTDCGIPADKEEIISSSFVMAKYLLEQSPGSRCYIIGPDPLREELFSHGFVPCDRPGEIDFVVLGIDRDFTYKKLQTAFRAIRAGAKFVATNPDPYSPAENGDLADIGALIAAIEVSSQHPVDMIVGKPSSFIVNLAIEALGLQKDKCLMVGDQLLTDVLAAKRMEVQVALFLRDPIVRAQLTKSEIKPDYYINKLTNLI